MEKISQAFKECCRAMLSDSKQEETLLQEKERNSFKTKRKEFKNKDAPNMILVSNSIIDIENPILDNISSIKEPGNNQSSEHSALEHVSGLTGLPNPQRENQPNGFSSQDQAEIEQTPKFGPSNGCQSGPNLPMKVPVRSHMRTAQKKKKTDYKIDIKTAVQSISSVFTVSNLEFKWKSRPSAQHR